MADTSGIYNVVGRARRRLKLQSALESATLAVVAAAASALVVVYAVRRGHLGASTGLALLAGCGALVILGGILGYLRRYPTTLVATRLDRASGLSDRLASACHFDQVLRAGDDVPDETRAFMRAAIADAIRVVPLANVVAATPFTAPREGRAALGVVAVAAILGGLILPRPDVAPALLSVSPAAAARGQSVEVRGARLCGPDREMVLPEDRCAQELEAGGEVPGVFLLGEGDAALVVSTEGYTDRGARLTVPAAAPVGPTSLRVRVGARTSEPIAFEVLAEDDPRAIPPDRVALDDDDLDYTRDLVAELRQTARQTEDLALETLADELDQLLDDAESGKLTKKQLLEELARAEDEYMKGSEDATRESVADLEETGKELAKQPLTRELGRALEKGQLDKAKQELEKLADQMERGEVSEKDQQKLAEAMQKAAERMQKADDQRQKAQDQELAKTQEQVRELERKLEQSESEKEQRELTRRLQQKKRELKRLQREKEQRDESESKRALKRLRRNMEKTAEQLSKPKGQKSRRQVSKSMRDLARDTGKVDADRRRIANRKKIVTQMSDLKEAMRRAKQKGGGGPKNRFGRNKRNRDFSRRARGGQGQKGAWRPGQTGQGQQGQGQGQQSGGQGQQPGGDGYGEGHDPNLMGDPTAKSGNTTDESLQGAHGQGASVRETVLTAAQKGFSSRSYEDVYTRYKTVVEEVIRAEKVPSGYKYYVKKYFQKIKPHAM